MSSMDATALMAAGRGLPCRSSGCRETFQPGVVPSAGTSSQGQRRRDEAQVRELLATAALRNEHEVAEHDYWHGVDRPPSATPFHDNDGHSNKTLRFDRVPL